jgi:peptidoglycan/LPS O-acetylase OafA/YrhL
MTNTGVLRAGKIPSLDGLRALAIAIVIWGHAELPMLIKGSTGVTIFFFLSGYLITTLLRMEADKRGRISIRDFYLRRVCRIFPPLYIVLALAIVFSLTGAVASAMSGAGIASSAGFWTNYFIVLDGRDGLPGSMNALWSLAVEEHYYLVFPLIYVAMRRWLPSRLHQTLVLVGICLAIMAWRVFLAGQGASWDRLYLSTDTRADAILWGSVMAIACNPVFGDIRARRRRRWLLNVVLVASAAVFYLVSRMPDSSGMTVGYTVQSIALFGVFIPLILAPSSVVGRVLNWRPVAFVGVLSYTLYLIHRPALELADKWLSLPHLVEVTIALVSSLAFAYAMYRLVDIPMGVLRKRISHTGDVGTPAHGQASRASA